MVKPASRRRSASDVSSALAANTRPWGRYDVLAEGAGFKVKRITIKPGQRLSYQRHRQRAEFWTFVAGQSLVTLDGTAYPKAAGETAQIAVGAKHRIENTGPKPLVFIEVQLGEYLGEDDIERFEDDYGRA